MTILAKQFLERSANFLARPAGGRVTRENESRIDYEAFEMKIWPTPPVPHSRELFILVDWQLQHRNTQRQTVPYK